jgi:hypothetical protein
MNGERASARLRSCLRPICDPGSDLNRRQQRWQRCAVPTHSVGDAGNAAGKSPATSYAGRTVGNVGGQSQIASRIVAIVHGHYERPPPILRSIRMIPKIALRAESLSLGQTLITSRSDGSSTDLGKSAPDSAPPLAESLFFFDDFDGGSSPSSAISREAPAIAEGLFFVGPVLDFTQAELGPETERGGGDFSLDRPRSNSGVE